MFLLFDGEEISLMEAEDFSRFHVEVRGLDPKALQRLMVSSGIGELRDNSAFVSLPAVTALAGDAADEPWKEKLGVMTEYAKTRGWLDESGRLEAHCEWSDGAT